MSNSSVFASRRPNGFHPSLIALNPRATACFSFSRSGSGSSDRSDPYGFTPGRAAPERVRLVEQERPVGLDPGAVDAAEQPRDRLVGELAEQVPEGDVDAADGVLDGPAAALPEGVLPQLLAHPGRLVRPLADQERPEQLGRRGHQLAAGERAADPNP